MDTRTRIASIATAGFALVALAACDPADPSPAPATTVTVTATVNVTPSPSAAAAAPDYGFTFFEEATIGSTFAQMSDQLNYPVAGIDGCPYYASVWNTEVATTYAFVDTRDSDDGVDFFYTNRFLASTSDPWPRNAEGVGIGSTQAELLAAYPGAVVDSIDDLGAGTITRVTVEDPDSDSKYVFGFTSGSSEVDLLQWGPGAGGQWSHLCGGF